MGGTRGPGRGDWFEEREVSYAAFLGNKRRGACMVEMGRMGMGRRSVKDCWWVGCWCDLGREMQRHDALSAVDIW